MVCRLRELMQNAYIPFALECCSSDCIRKKSLIHHLTAREGKQNPSRFDFSKCLCIESLLSLYRIVSCLEAFGKGWRIQYNEVKILTNLANVFDHIRYDGLVLAFETCIQCYVFIC